MDNRIQQLKFRLSSAGVEAGEIDYLVNEIMERAKGILDNTLEAGVSLAVEEANSMGAKDFLKEISIKPTMGGFEITSDSGRSDFSSPPFPMLDKLLARGKTAKDGSTYRVIPIGAPSIKQPQQQKDISSGLHNASLTKNKGSLTDMAASMAGAFGIGAKKITIQTPSSPGKEVAFRTATSKQDRNSQWVIPARSADMSPALSNINHMMMSDIERAISNAIDNMENEIKDAIEYSRR